MAMITTSIQALQAALPGKRIWELDITRRGRPYIHEKLEAELGGGGHRNSSGVELSFTQLSTLLTQLNVAI